MASARARRGRPWRRWLFVLLGIALLVFVVSQLTTVSALGADLSGADGRWLAVALALQVAFFLLYGGLYQAGLGAVEVEGSALRLVPVLLASIFAKTVLPLTAAPAAAVFIDDATSRGQSGPRTAAAMIVVLVVDLVTALPFVAAGPRRSVLRSTLVGFALTGTGLFAVFIAASSSDSCSPLGGRRSWPRSCGRRQRHEPRARASGAAAAAAGRLGASDRRRPRRRSRVRSRATRGRWPWRWPSASPSTW